MNKKITVYAPASIGNVNVGFDVLGAAITPINGQLLGDQITLSEADQFQLISTGDFVQSLPKRPEENLVYQCCDYFSKKLNKKLNIAVTLTKNMPIGSGLGSSACSVVATLFALNYWYGSPFTQHQLLKMMGTMEGNVSGSIHYDNVAPAYLGGLQLILPEQPQISQAIPCFDEWLWVMAYPGISLSTAAARQVLPENYSRQTCIQYGSHLAGFIHACHSRQADLAAKLLVDVLAEPYRQELLPNFIDVKQQVMAYGSLACGISGAGPTLFALTNDLNIAQDVAQYLSDAYLKNRQGFVHICRLDKLGTRVIESHK